MVRNLCADVKLNKIYYSLKKKLLMIFGLLVNGIMASVQRKRAEREREAAMFRLDKDESTIDNMFNAEYYKDFTNRADVQSLLHSAKEQQKDLTRQNRKSVAVMGGTEEAVSAMQNNANSNLADTYGNIAAIGTQWKDSLYNNYLNRKSALSDKRYGVYQNAANLFGSSSNEMLTEVSKGLSYIDKPITDLATFNLFKLGGKKK